MLRGKSYIKDSGDFINKIKNLKNISEGVILVSVDIVGLYLSIPCMASLNALREALHTRENKHIPKDNLLKIVEIALKNNYFEFNCKVKKQLFSLSGLIHGKEKLASFLNISNNYHSNINFTHESSKEHTPFLDVNMKL